jgi:hypothetical protein
MVNDEPLSKMEIPKPETLVAIAEPDTVDAAESVIETAIIVNMVFADFLNLAFPIGSNPG